MKTLVRAFKWSKDRFDNVWIDKYTLKWHLIDLLLGILISVAFVVDVRNDYSVGTLIGLFFGVSICGYIMVLAFTYGIVRSRRGWTKKRK